MFANAVLSFWRNLLRHRLYTALNIAGLALGVCVFLVLTLVVRYERGFDAWIPGVGQLYRLDSTGHEPGLPAREFGMISFKAYDDLRAMYPQIADGTRYMSRSVTVRIGSKLLSQNVDYTDPQFLRVFRYPLIAGSAATALSHPDGLVLTEATARAWFGTSNAIGRHVEVNYSGRITAHTVTGVLRALPGATSLPVEAIMPFDDVIRQERPFVNWDSSSGGAVFRLTPEMAGDLRRDFPNALRRLHADSHYAGDPNDRVSLSLIPWRAVHFHDVSVAFGVDASDPRVVTSLAVVGILALLAAAINYVNLATARSLLRAREVAMRKVMGATKGRLIGQYLIEAMVLVGIASVIGTVLAELFLPVVAALGGWQVTFDYGFAAIALLAIILIVGLGAGAYPAFALASFKPGVVLGASKIAGGGRASARLRAGLVGVQFAFAVGFAICALVVQAQAAYMRNEDRGFSTTGLIVVDSLSDDGLKEQELTIADALRRVPGVRMVTLQNFTPGNNGDNNTTNFRRPGMVSSQDLNLARRTIGADYFRTYGAHIVAGRDFDANHAQDDFQTDEKHYNIVIDVAAAERLGFSAPADAVGQTLLSGSVIQTIIGVVSDIRFGSARAQNDPQVYVSTRKPFMDAQAAVRFTGPAPAVMDGLARAWHDAVPGVAFSAKTVDDTLSQYYRPDEHRGELFAGGAVVAVLVACLGLYGLAAFNATRRLHEIGVRKTLGASTRQVLTMVIVQFLRPVLLAGVIACPAAFMLMRAWLSGFDQRIALSPLYFAGVLAGALVLCTITVFSQTFRLARAEPARALRAQ